MSYRRENGGDPRHDLTLDVTEIFKSIQGESSWAGKPCVFVRLTGCNLRCAWCDTPYAYKGGEELRIGDILCRCDEMDCGLVEITGGEPLLQENCAALAACLMEQGRTVLCETNGTMRISALPDGVIRIMDIKCPDSGEHDKVDWSNVEKLGRRDEVKFVVASRTDYEWARDVVRDCGLSSRCAEVLFSPVSNRVEPRALAEWIVEDGLDARFQLQLHKLVWPADQKGV